ncbi:MAG: SIS domain-containing protein [Thermoplasmata archaeon]|nr:SIS domain-containing protein [Thermoplasmata archaeon]
MIVKDDVEKALDYICKSMRTGLKMDEKEFKKIEEMVSLIISSKKIFLYGVGRSGLIAKAFAIRLVQLGLNVFFIGDSNTPMVEKDSVVIIMSNTGQTMSAVQTANITRRMGAKVIAITSNSHSKLALAASEAITVASSVPDDKMRLEYAPLGTVFEQSAGILLDAIVTILMKRLEETDQTMRQRHAIWV